MRTRRSEQSRGIGSRLCSVNIETWYLCTECGSQFLHREDLLQHKIVEHSSREIDANSINAETFTANTNIETEIFSRNAEETTAYQDCNGVPREMGELQRSFPREMPKEEFLRKSCLEKFRTRTLSEIHGFRYRSFKMGCVKVHLFSCGQCKLKYRTHEKLFWHMLKKHSRPKPYVCRLCHKRFSSQYYCDVTHMLSHRSEKSGKKNIKNSVTPEGSRKKALFRVASVICRPQQSVPNAEAESDSENVESRSEHDNHESEPEKKFEDGLISCEASFNSFYVKVHKLEAEWLNPKDDCMCVMCNPYRLAL